MVVATARVLALADQGAGVLEGHGVGDAREKHLDAVIVDDASTARPVAAVDLRQVLPHRDELHAVACRGRGQRVQIRQRCHVGGLVEHDEERWVERLPVERHTAIRGTRSPGPRRWRTGVARGAGRAPARTDTTSRRRRAGRRGRWPDPWRTPPTAPALPAIPARWHRVQPPRTRRPQDRRRPRPRSRPWCTPRCAGARRAATTPAPTAPQPAHRTRRGHRRPRRPLGCRPIARRRPWSSPMPLRRRAAERGAWPPWRTRSPRR